MQVTYPRSHRLSRVNLGLKPISLDSRSSAQQHFKTLFLKGLTSVPYRKIRILGEDLMKVIHWTMY